MDPQTLYTTGATNFLIALASVITAVGVVWCNVIITRAKVKVESTAVKVEKKADEIAETTKVTLGHVNSAATEMRAQIASLLHDNDQLRVLLSENKQIAAVLAATQAALAMPAGVPPVRTRREDGTVLDAIEKHTKDTAENTARTEEAVAAAVEKVIDPKS